MSSGQDGNYVRIFDTTLRDGEQSPGATMTSVEKLEVARMLARLGVDVIEAGFPAASPDDLKAVTTIAQEVGQAAQLRGETAGLGGETAGEGRAGRESPIICGLARAMESDIRKAWQAVSPAKRSRIHTFIATSPIHREHKLRMSREQVVARVREMVGLAASLCPDVEFSPEDAGRTEADFLYEVLAAAIEAGATTLNIPDTVGYTMPDEFGQVIAGIRANVPNVERAVISVHCHNDLGLATANSLAGVQNGARQIEVAVNGIGERAGNTSLEEIVMTLHTRQPKLGLRTGIDTTHLMRASKHVSKVTGMVVQPNKAIVGANAFAHEAGIHQDGMLKHQETYEIMRPETVGATQTMLVLGKHSGRHAFAVRLQELGFHLEGEALDKAFARFKTLADKKKRMTDADLAALVNAQLSQPTPFYTLDALQVACGTTGMPTATVRLKDPAGKLCTECAVGTGPVDAAYRAIKIIVGASAVLVEYSVQAVTEGIDALGEVSVRIRDDEPGTRVDPQQGKGRTRAFHGYGADTDIIVASAKAYLAALNRLLGAQQSLSDQEDAVSDQERGAQAAVASGSARA